MKSDIWALSDNPLISDGPARDQEGEELRIVVPYSDSGHCVSKKWKDIIRNNAKFHK